MSDIEGKAARAAAMECGKRQGFKPRNRIQNFLISLAVICLFLRHIEMNLVFGHHRLACRQYVS